MSRAENAVREIHRMDCAASQDQWANRLHPLVKFLLTVYYIALTVSFSKYDVIGICGMVIYPLVMFLLSELSFSDCLRRLKLVLPLVCVVGILNPFLDHTTIELGGIEMSAGVLSMLTLICKGVFSLLASYLLIATTSIDQLCYAFRLLHMPKILMTQILLTYRYITVLLEEVSRMMQAYALRAPNQKGIHITAWGSLTGQLLLRSVDRANVVYESMVLRGYRGSFANIGEKTRLRAQDIAFFAVWLTVLTLFRKYPVFILIGNLTGGLFT